MIELGGFDNLVRKAADRESLDLVPLPVRHIYCERDLVVAREVPGFLRPARTAEVDRQSLAHILDRGRLGVAIAADGGDGHVLLGLQYRRDLVLESFVHGPHPAYRSFTARPGPLLPSTSLG